MSLLHQSVLVIVIFIPWFVRWEMRNERRILLLGIRSPPTEMNWSIHRILGRDWRGSNPQLPPWLGGALTDWLTEKEIMRSYDICSSLVAAKNVPNTEELPISKVAIFLVDSKKENCFLKFDSFASVLWYLIKIFFQVGKQRISPSMILV